MFGYVIADRERLSPAGQERYRACYCGLCHALGRRHGAPARLTLSYDTTFLAILLGSLYQDLEPECEGCRRCVMHPVHRHCWHGGAAWDYAADMTVALAYYNAMDKWQDDRSLPARALALALAPRLKVVERQWPRQCETIRRELAALGDCEAGRVPATLDGVSDCFGRLLAELFCWKQDEWSGVLRAMGMSLGKFIYLCDAWEDLPRDEKTGSYNPLRALAREPDYEQQIDELLNLLAAQTAECYRRLPCVQDTELLENILYSGIWVRYQTARAGQKGEKE